MTMLGKMGHRITLATNGLEALEQWRQSDFDLILMDVQMPEMSGLQATMQIRREEAIGAHVTIVAMTASAMSEDRDRCLAAGMDDFISKPVSYKGIEQVITATFSGGKFELTVLANLRRACSPGGVERFQQQVSGSTGKALIVYVRVKLDQFDCRAKGRLQGAAVGVERLRRIERSPRLVDGGNTLQGDQHGHRPARAVKPGSRDASDLRTLFGRCPHQRDRRVVNVQLATAKLDRHRFHRTEIDHVDGAGTNELGNALAPSCFQPVRPRAHNAPY